MRKRAFRPLTMMLSLLLAASTTVQAGPISISEVVQVLGSNSSRAPELRLRNVWQTSSLAADNETTKSAGGSQPVSNQPSSVDLVDTTIGAAPNSADSLLAGVAVSGDNAQNTDVISQGDLEGSICDCGEIPTVTEHHIPKWPLLFLAAIPLLFIHHHDCDTCTSTPTPTPTPTPPPGVPEPTSLLLMGSGLAALGAGLRRRYARGKLEQEIASTEEG
jgi:PEP-CTERM motif